MLDAPSNLDLPPRAFDILKRILPILVLAIATSSTALSLDGILADGTALVAGARVGLIGARRATTTDSLGRFSFRAAPTPRAWGPPRWSRSGQGVEIRAEEPILWARLVGLDGRHLATVEPGARIARLVLRGKARGTVVLEVRTASGRWTHAIGFPSSIEGSKVFAPRAMLEQDTLCVVAEGRPILKIPVVDSTFDARFEVPRGRWVSGDFHTHTVLTDGSHTMPDVFAHAFGGRWDLLDGDGAKRGDSTVAGFGLDWIANSEHGGAFCRDPLGLPWSTPAKGSPPAGCLWRWQSLLEASWPLLDSLRSAHPGKTLIQGLEWNVPAHDHASVGILARSARAIATFEYLFDAADSDTDPSGGILHLSPDQPKNLENTHDKALDGMRWLQRHHRDSSYVVLNHPSRVLRTSASDLRDYLDEAPDVFLGIEAMPGHPHASARGYYSAYPGIADPSPARTSGGADHFLAKLGGVADAIWSEGRHLRIFANSDFHLSSETNDAYPGEYARNTNLARDTGAAALLAALREGAGHCQIGGLVGGLDLLLDDGVSTARAGGSLRRESSSDSVTIRVRWKPAGPNNRGVVPVLHHLDLIRGPLVGTSNQDREKSSVDGVVIAKRLHPSDFHPAEDGWFAATVGLRPGGPSFFRLRGTNQAPSRPGETDDLGNPLPDDATGANTATKAWSDLWVYTNPVFLLR